MQLRRLDLLVTLAFLAFGIWVLVHAVDYGVTSNVGPGAGTFPLVAGVLIAGFSALNLVRAGRGHSSISQETSVDLQEVGKCGAIIALILLYIFAFQDLGAFLPLPFLMASISLVIHWRIDWAWLAILASVCFGFTVACYFIFEVFLKVLLPEGPFGF